MKCKIKKSKIWLIQKWWIYSVNASRVTSQVKWWEMSFWRTDLTCLRWASGQRFLELCRHLIKFSISRFGRRWSLHQKNSFSFLSNFLTRTLNSKRSCIKWQCTGVFWTQNLNWKIALKSAINKANQISQKISNHKFLTFSENLTIINLTQMMKS